jgi:hypothetical protein
MSAVIHLSHQVFYNIVLAAAVVVLLWVLIYLVGAELAHHAPAELIAPL